MKVSQKAPSSKTQRPTLWLDGFFCLLAIAWSALIWLGLCRHSEPASPRYYVAYFLALCGPSLAGLVCAAISDGKRGVLNLVRRIFVPNMPWWTLLVAVFLPPLIMLIAASVSRWIFHAPVNLTLPSPGAIALSFLIVLWRFGPLNEELGWRGFLLPRLLERFSPLAATLCLAPLWAVWHLPLWALKDSGHHLWPFGLFLALIVPVTGLFSWLAIHGRQSLVPAILLHTSLNVSANFIPLTPPAHSSLAPFGCWIVITGVFAAALWLIMPPGPATNPPSCRM